MTVRRTMLAEPAARRAGKTAREAGTPAEARDRLAAARGFAASLDQARLRSLGDKEFAEVAGPAVYRKPRKTGKSKRPLRRGA
jgi:hypothetical protein